MALAIVDQLRDEFDFSVHAVRGIGRDAAGREMQTQLRAQQIPFSAGLRIPMRWGGLFSSAAGLARAIHTVRPDVLHLHTEIPEAAYAVMLAMRLRRPDSAVVRTLHNSVIWNFAPPLAKWCGRRLAGLPSAAVSAGAAAALPALHKRIGVPLPTATQTPRIIFNGVAPADALQSPRSAPPASAPLKLVFGGRFEYEKGSDLLPAIVRQTPLPAGRMIRFDIFGHGPHAARLRELAAHPPSGWQIVLHAPVADFATRLHDFDLLVMPSRWEGLGLVALEAIWAGIPIVGTSAAGCREVFFPGHPWLAAPDDASAFARELSTALHETSRWPSVVRAAQEFARARFTLEQMAAGYRAFYHHALAARRDATGAVIPS